MLEQGHRWVAADLHAHSRYSDGLGDPAKIHDQMRAAGLDAGSVADHSIAAGGRTHDRDPSTYLPANPDGSHIGRITLGVNDDCWADLTELADAADEPGRFVAVPGFEWSSPHLGHVCVWFSPTHVDALQVGALTVDGLDRAGVDLDMLAENFAHIPHTLDLVHSVRAAPTRGMDGFWEWLAAAGDGVLGAFNHPYRELPAFDDFRYAPAVADRMVAFEIFNREDDYLFCNFAERADSPLVRCLRAGWWTGLIGGSDGHGADYRLPDGTGRTGLWTRELTRAGVAEALRARRTVASRVADLRLSVRVDGVAMGGRVVAPGAEVRLEVALAAPSAAGSRWELQVLCDGPPAGPDEPGADAPGVPRVVHIEPVTVPAGADGTVTTLRLRPPPSAGWLVVRVADPARPNPWPGPDGHPGNAYAVAYASPVALGPAGADEVVR